MKKKMVIELLVYIVAVIIGIIEGFFIGNDNLM
jgi:uncharacterized protein YneF (UPF0154 family)